MEHERRVVGCYGRTGVVAKVLATQHPLLRDDGQHARVEVRRELGERVVLRDDLGERPESEADDTRLDHRRGERCRSVERDAVGGVARRPPQLAAGPLGRLEAGVAQREQSVPV